MKRILIPLFLLVILSFFTDVPVFAENTADVPMGRPVIDGEIDSVWSYAAAFELQHITTDSRFKDDDHAKANVRLLWDEQYIYCLVEVKDKSVSDSGTEWRQDSVEYFIDALNTKSYAMQAENNGQYRLGCSGAISGSGGYDEVTFKKNSFVKRTSDGYLEEVAIPLYSHKVTGKEGMKVGFDFQLNDDSNNDGDRDYIISWNQDGMGYENPSQLGTITLVAPMPGAPSPEPLENKEVAPVVSPTPVPVLERTLVLKVDGSNVKAFPPITVSNFETMSLYWNPGIKGQEKLTCSVSYRAKGLFNKWKNAMDLLYDSRTDRGRPAEFRGSIVGLKPGIEYEIKLTLSNGASTRISASTMSESFPIGEKVYLPKTSSTSLTIDSGGKPDAYKLYTFDPSNGSAAIDVDNKEDTCITVSAPYVIIRGLNLKGAKNHGINLVTGAHHVIIEDNDISGWGSFTDEKNGLGADMQAGIHASMGAVTITDIIIQFNKIHNPRTSANSWDYGHPAGPQGISFQQNGAGHHIIRYNEITGDDTHFFNDGIGGAENYSLYGFPGPDSDVYGNLVANAYDDGMEIEGGGMNVRVWGNYLDKTGTGISSASCSLGPLYIYRNVYNTSRMFYQLDLDKDDRGGFGKAGDDEKNTVNGGGRRYYFHNTTLQAPPPQGSSQTLGAGWGIYDVGGPITNTISENNIWHTWTTYWSAISDRYGSKTNEFDYDLYNGRIDAYPGAEPYGIKGIPVYAPENGWESASGGMYALDPKSPGYHAAVKIPNFNDMYKTPDIGAHQSGAPPMLFGLKARPANAMPAQKPHQSIYIIILAATLIFVGAVSVTAIVRRRKTAGKSA